jgi:soluble lytic murein transglycosylase-like protein
MQRRVSAAVAIACLSFAASARAELAYFASGQALSIRGHRTDGNLLVLSLRGGGEMTCEPSLVARFGPDEVAYPEDEPPAPVAARQQPASEDLTPYSAIIDRVASEQGVDPKLVRALIKVESAYQPRARSRKGAMGLMQLMPDTARRYAVRDPYEPVSNIEAGIKHLRALLDRYPRELALAAHNAGEAAVERFRGMPPYPETRLYVSRILALFNR